MAATLNYDCSFNSPYFCLVGGGTSNVKKIPDNCVYNSGIQCQQTGELSGYIKRTVNTSKSDVSCPSEILQKCTPCEWKKQCTSKRTIQEVAQNLELSKCFYGKDNVRNTDQPCNDYRCADGLLYYWDSAGVDNSIGKRKKCTLQCNTKRKRIDVSYLDDNGKSKTYNTYESCK